MTLPLHFAASSVDVLSDVVYYWRTREGADLSITQRRTELRSLNDRLTAIEEVSEYLADARAQAREALVRRERRGRRPQVLPQRARRGRRRVPRGLLRSGQPLPGGRQLRAPSAACGPTSGSSGISCAGGCCRSCWRSCASSARTRPRPPPVRVRGHWYLDHPFRTDRSLKIPRSLFRVDRELRVLHRARRPRLAGREAAHRGLGVRRRDRRAGEARSQRVTLTAVRPGRLRPVKLRVGGVRLRAQPVHRADLVDASGTELADVELGRLQRRAAGGQAAHQGPLARGPLGPARHGPHGPGLPGALALHAPTPRARCAPRRPCVADGVVAATAPEPTGEVRLLVHTEWAAVREHRLQDGALVLGRRGAPEGLRAAGAPARWRRTRKTFPLERSGVALQRPRAARRPRRGRGDLGPLRRAAGA